MPCPTCGYVSFDSLEACRGCGAILHEERRRRGTVAFSGAPVTPSSQSAAPRGTSLSGVPEDHQRALDAVLTSAIPPHGRTPMTHQEGADRGTICLSTDTLESPASPLSSGLPTAAAWRDASSHADAGALPKAGIWIRMAAWIADVLFLFFPTIVAALVVWATINLGGWLGGEINDQVKVFAGISSVIIVMVGGFQYFTLFVGWRGQTPGKMLFGLKIVRVTGERMTYGRACLRSLCWILSLLLFSIGFLMIAFTRQRQGLHDVLTGSYVIRLRGLL